ncbi:MAG: HlyD family type I secretion periplasmic adaptor subunit [Pseudomonadota bacterium]
MKALKKVEATEVVAHDVEPLTVNTDARVYTKLGWLITLIGVGGFLLWAIFAPLDKGVPMSATVVKESNRKQVQHLAGGMVDEILVRDGDVVKAGQVLVRMNAVNAKANSEITNVQLNTMRATEARLLAEREGRDAIAFPKDLQERKKTDMQLAGTMEGQQMLFSSRRMALQNELAAAEDNAAGLKLQINGLEESRESIKLQLGIIKEQLENVRSLAAEGYVPRARLLELERSAAQLSGALSENMGNIGRAKQQVLELANRRAQRQQEFQKEVRGLLTDVQKEVQGLSARSGAQQFELANTDVKAPVDGVVVGTSVFTRGGIVGPGVRLMDIVPAADALVVEGMLPVNLIDKVHKGLPVELIFSAFNTNTTPNIPGELVQIAADRTIDEHTGAPYYKVTARVTPAGLKIIADKKLEVRPGMPVELFVKTGSRSMMSYLLKPVVDRAKTSMTED